MKIAAVIAAGLLLLLGPVEAQADHNTDEYYPRPAYFQGHPNPPSWTR